VPVALAIHDAMLVHLIVLHSMAFQHISTLAHKRYFFEKHVIENKMFRLFLQLLSATFLVLRRNERDVIRVHRSLHKVPNILARC
jgi:hypothetical protein